MAVLWLMNFRIALPKLGEWLDRPITRNGLLCSLGLPAVWLLWFHSFVLHVRFSLGRWTGFGESLTDWSLQMHFAGVAGLGLGLF